MGAEDFQVTLFCEQPFVKSAYLLSRQEQVRHIDSLGSSSDQYVYEDDRHLVEFEIMATNEGSRISGRFALCQRETIVDCFLSQITGLAFLLKASVVINDEVVGSDPYEFSLGELGQLPDVLRRAIDQKRSLWVADFGAETAKVTCEEAVTRFIVGRSGGKGPNRGPAA